MKLEEIMVKNVVTIGPNDSTVAAAQRMREKAVGCLVVTIGKAIQGIITDRDLLGCISEGHDLHLCKLSTHMNRPVVTERPEEELLTAAEVMARRRIKRLPIVKEGELVGIVSISDFAGITHEQAKSLWPTWVSVATLLRAQALHWRKDRHSKAA